MSIQIDKYLLTQSEQHAVKIGDEVRADLKLQTNQSTELVVIIGSVKNKAGEPLPNAIIKVADEKNNCLNHSHSDKEGNFSVTAPPNKGTYNVYAVLPGYLLTKNAGLVIQPRQTVQSNFILPEDPNLTQSYIAGHITTTEDKPLDKVIVTLLSINPETQAETSIGFLLTNEYGQYVFNNLLPGSYKIHTEFTGYKAATIMFTITEVGQILSGDIIMELDVINSKGSIHGIIVDTDGIKLENALVVLYQVIDEKLFPIKTTYSNEDGCYLFYDVNPGNYIVKSTKKSYTE